MNRRPLIIHNPSLQTLRQRYAYTALTLLFWIVWLWLWTPLITLCAWLLSGERFYDTMVRLGGIEMVREMLGMFALGVSCLGVGLIGWALYNRWLVRGRDKRRASPVASDEAIGEYFLLAPAQLELLRSSRLTVITHDEDGRITALGGEAEAEPEKADAAS